MREKLESLLVMPRSQATSSTPLINHCHCLREGLKIEPESTTFNSFVSGSNIPDLILASVKPLEAGFIIWQGHC